MAALWSGGANVGACNAPFQIYIRLVDPNLIRGVLLLITLNLEL